MNEGLFRKKSLERISSPEQLDDYIKVATPGVWMILSCIIILLAGMCVWGVFGKLNTTVTAPAICNDGKTICYVSETVVSDIKEGMNVIINEEEYSVTAAASEPVKITEAFSDYALHIGGLQLGEWVYEISVDAELNDGIYSAEIVTESIAPMSFLVN